MYEKIRQGSTRPRILPMGLALGACAAITALIVGLVLWAGWYQMAFREFVSHLSNSTTYAYEHNSLAITLGGQAYTANRENIYPIYTAITNAGPGRLGDRPASPPEAVLEYGDGSRLELWMVELKNPSTHRTKGLFLFYVNQEGETYSYDSDRLELLALPVEPGDQ